MSALNTKPGTMSDAQRHRLFGAAQSQGMDIEQLRSVAGGSISALSRAQASELIDRLGGGQLTNPPGEAPPPARRPSKPGVLRMITREHIEQIARLMTEAFDAPAVGYRWLLRDFKANTIRELGTAERAGHVIRVLRLMTQRRSEPHVGNR